MAPGHVPPGSRARLVDTVMDLPEVQASARLEATVPLGDTGLLERLRQRTRDAVRARLAAPRCWTRTYPARPSSSALATTGGGTSVSRLPARRISRSRVNGTVRYQNCPNACCRHARIGRSGRVMRRLGQAA